MKSIIRFIPVRSYFFNLMLDLKRIFNNLIFGVLKPKIFIILFGFFFSSLTLALAATLSVTWKGGLIPAGNNFTGASCVSSSNGNALNRDRTEDPHDVQFSADGLQVFTVNFDQNGKLESNRLSMNRLSNPFEITSTKTNNGSTDCNDIDGFAPDGESGSALNAKLVDLNIVDGGRIFFILDINGELGKFNMSTPFDTSTGSYEGKLSMASDIDSVSFNRDGSKLFTLSGTANTPTLTTFSLPGSFNISSTTQVHQVDLSTIGVTLTDDEDDIARDIEFNDTGSAMFIMVSNDDDLENQYIYQYSLGKNYDVSTATKIGRWNIGGFGNRSTTEDNAQFGQPRGFSFSSDGTKIFIVEIRASTGVDQINQFDLECPYGLVQCTSDSASNLGSQVQLAKQNIGLNTSIIFKRFEWVKRNRNSENLNSFNININSHNPLLASLANKFQTSKYKRQASLNNNSLSNNKKSKWSYWSHGDISIGNYEDTLLEKPKKIKTTGLTFGADRKYGDNKFAGLAIRYAENAADIKGSAQQTDMESLTLNIYGIIPRDENKYINAVLGLSALRFDQKYLGQLTGERNGKQAFAAVNYRTKKSYGDLNLTPSGRFTYAVTQLSDFTDFISTVKPGADIIYEEDTFESGEVAAGFLFNLNDIETPDGIFKPNGGLEIVYDITPDVKLEYSNQGSSNVNTATIEQYSHKNIRANIGIEAIYNNGLTLSLNYERFQHIDSHRYSHTDSFLIKVGHIIEEDSEFAFNFDPLKNNEASIDYTKNINGFDVKVSSNYSLMSEIPDYAANLEISNTF